MGRGEAWYYFSSSNFVLILSVASSSTYQLSSSRPPKKKKKPGLYRESTYRQPNLRLRGDLHHLRLHHRWHATALFVTQLTRTARAHSTHYTLGAPTCTSPAVAWRFREEKATWSKNESVVAMRVRPRKDDRRPAYDSTSPMIATDAFVTCARVRCHRPRGRHTRARASQECDALNIHFLNADSTDDGEGRT